MATRTRAAQRRTTKKNGTARRRRTANGRTEQVLVESAPARDVQENKAPLRESPDIIDLRHVLMTPGLHISPLRDEKGRLVIVQIGEHSQLTAMWPVEQIADSWTYGVEYEAHRLPDALRSDVRQSQTIEDFTVSNRSRSILGARGLGDRFLASGWTRSAVFVLPWNGMMNAENWVLAITDENGCAHAYLEVSEDMSDEALRWPLTFLYENRRDNYAVEPFPYFASGVEQS